VTAPVSNNNDIGELSAAVNELSANFQEVVLLTGAAAGNSFAAIEEIEKTLNEGSFKSDADLGQQMSAIKRDMQTLRGLVTKFKFYKACFDGLKVKSCGHKVDSSM
jgi:methyl-accepting chemotaxis protein